MAGNPLQSFIQDYMNVVQMMQRDEQLKEQQRQFDMQQTMATDQHRAQMIGAFSTLAGKVQNPQELTALADYFARQDPDLAPVFTQLAGNIAPSMQAMMEGAMYRAGPQAAEQALAISQGRQLSAGQEQQGNQFTQTFTRGVLESDRNFGRNILESDRSFAAQNDQFERNFAQRQAEFEGTMGFNRAQLAQQGALGQMSVMGSAGLLPMQMRGALSQEIDGIRTVLQQQGGMMRPEERARLNSQIADLTAQMGRFDTMASGQGMDMNQLFSNIASAQQDMMEAGDPAQRQIAAQRYNLLAPRAGLPQINYDTQGINEWRIGAPGQTPSRNPWLGTFMQGWGQ